MLVFFKCTDYCKYRPLMNSVFVTNLMVLTPLPSYVTGESLLLPPTVDLLLTPHQGSALRPALWREAALLVRMVEQVRVSSEGRELGWPDLCASYEGRCVDNSFLDLVEVEDLAKLSFPLHGHVPLVAHLGGVQVEEDRLVEAAALRITWVLADDLKQEEHRKLWIAGVAALVGGVRLQEADIHYFWTGIVEQDLMRNIHESMEVLPLTVFLMVVYTVVSSMTTDWVTSKPYLAVAGLLVVLMAMVSGFGLALCVFPWQAINLVSLFLLLGIGLDSVFLLLSAWTRTAASKDVVARLELTYKDAAASLTITSLTNVLGFTVGAVMPGGFPCVQNFCTFAALGLTANYVLMVTAFGSCLTFMGRLEEGGRHSLLWARVSPKSEISSFLHQWLLAGGRRKLPEEKKVGEGNVMVFFRDVFSPFISHGLTKMMILLTFITYVVLACWGLSKLEEGLDRSKLTTNSSPLAEYFLVEEQYFRDNPYRLQLVIATPLDYSDVQVQKQVLDLIQKLEDLPFVSRDPAFRQSWLHMVLDFSKENFLVFNITTKSQFMMGLKLFLKETKRLKHPASQDVRFSADGTNVDASRFFLQTGRVANSMEEMMMLTKLREVIKGAPFPDVYIYNPYFPFFDQFLDVKWQTIYAVLACIVVISFVTLIFLPDRLSCISILFTIISVELGVLGFMAHWGVHLDVISMIVLIMGIGFSVDCSAHISYHYLSSNPDLDPKTRLANCLFAMGAPVVQGVVTTLIGVLPLMLMDSYIIQTFAKVIILVISLSLVHSLFLLPTLLTSLPVRTCSFRLQPTATSSSKLSDTFVFRREEQASLRRQTLFPRARRHVASSPVRRRTGMVNPSFLASPEGGESPSFHTFRPERTGSPESASSEGKNKFVFLDEGRRQASRSEEEWQVFDEIDLGTT